MTERAVRARIESFRFFSFLFSKFYGIFRYFTKSKRVKKSQKRVSFYGNVERSTPKRCGSLFVFLTKYERRGTIMAWREEDHPRDDDGKFTDGNGTYRQNSLEPYKSAKRKNFSAITKREWARWYAAVGEI